MFNLFKMAKKKADSVEEEVVVVQSGVCPNCEDSGLSCSVCKKGKDDVDVV